MKDESQNTERASGMTHSKILPSLIVILLVLIGALILWYTPGNSQQSELNNNSDVGSYLVDEGNNRFTFRRQSFSFTIPSTWQQIEADSASLPLHLERMQFAFSKPNTLCVLAYVETFGHATKSYKQTSFAEKASTNDGDQVWSSWHVLEDNLTDTFAFDWKGRQPMEGEVRIRTFPHIFTTSGEIPLYSFILYSRDGGLVPNDCDSDFSNVLRSINRKFETTAITSDSSGIAYITASHLRSNPLSYLMFVEEGNDVKKKAMEIDIQHNPTPTMYRDDLYFMTKGGSLRTLDPISGNIADVIGIKQVSGSVINDFYFVGDTMYYLLGINCNYYLAKCGLDLYSLDVSAQRSTLHIRNLPFRRIEGYKVNTNSLVLSWRDGDGGCVWANVAEMFLDDNVISEANSYSHCSGMDHKDTEENDKNRDELNAIMGQFAKQKFTSDYLLIRDGEIVLTEDDFAGEDSMWSIRFIR
ncbi:hypothetical protein COB55_05925 [Candidatus Wolfebacteria bacterium]|nr:MAG: hypothetical protein COB55_05925 [Candidatus Wolfebacteria bacterium]